MINTEQKGNTVPLYWLLILAVPVAMGAYIEKCSGTAMPYTIKKFSSNPMIIASLGSINIAFNILLAPWIAYRSDNCWSFLGRRKTFIITGLGMMAFSMILIPLADNLILLTVLIIFYQMSFDAGFTGPWKPLYFDIVPHGSRGKGMVINRYLSIAARLVFMFFLIGKFSVKSDGTKAVKSLSKKLPMDLTGEDVIYFGGAVLAVISIIILVLFVRERPAEKKNSSEGRSFIKAISCVFSSRQSRLMCLLVFSSVLMKTKLLTLRPLLITEQFGYSMQQMGNFHTVSMLINIVVILPIAAMLIDKIDKFKIYIAVIILSTIQPGAFWIYVKIFAVGGIPSPGIIIGFNIADAIFDQIGLLAIWPLLYDMIQPSMRGIMTSGFLIASGLAGFINANGIGVWVNYYSKIFCQDGNYDYMSGYLYVFTVGVIGCLMAVYFGLNYCRIKDSRFHHPQYP